MKSLNDKGEVEKKEEKESNGFDAFYDDEDDCFSELLERDDKQKYEFLCCCSPELHDESNKFKLIGKEEDQQKVLFENQEYGELREQN